MTRGDSFSLSSDSEASRFNHHVMLSVSEASRLALGQSLNSVTSSLINTGSFLRLRLHQDDSWGFVFPVERQRSIPIQPPRHAERSEASRLALEQSLNSVTSSLINTGSFLRLRLHQDDSWGFVFPTERQRSIPIQPPRHAERSEASRLALEQSLNSVMSSLINTISFFRLRLHQDDSWGFVFPVERQRSIPIQPPCHAER